MLNFHGKRYESFLAVICRLAHQHASFIDFQDTFFFEQRPQFLPGAVQSHLYILDGYPNVSAISRWLSSAMSNSLIIF